MLVCAKSKIGVTDLKITRKLGVVTVKPIDFVYSGSSLVHMGLPEGILGTNKEFVKDLFADAIETDALSTILEAIEIKVGPRD